MGTSRTIKEKPRGAGELPAIGPGPTVKRGMNASINQNDDSGSRKEPKGMKTQYGGE